MTFVRSCLYDFRFDILYNLQDFPSLSLGRGGKRAVVKEPVPRTGICYLSSIKGPTLALSLS